ncbi:adenosine receptor A1-like [Polypterus senegalus]|uniref:adenosine receptor A1-like n=1 Tax=Polypterus senegalus TaxID=55291 RepID=UPI001964460F|nr:adenosine receptor A1-like [Polypterus senegalus]
MSDGSGLQGHVDALYISVEAVIALASVLGNTLVVLVVKINRALRDTTFCFIVSLAMADIAVGALVIPLAIVINIGFRTQFYTCLFLTCLLLIITQSSILSLMAIAIDRYLRVKIPTRYCIIVTQQRAWMAVSLCWLLSMLTGLVPMLGWHNEEVLHSKERNVSSGNIICHFSTVMRMDYMVYFNFFGWVVLPLTIMVGLYIEIFYVIRKQLNKRAQSSSDASKYYGKELKLAKSLVLVVFLFVISWMPLHIMNCISYFCPQCQVPKSALYIGIFMSHANSAVNPLVYAFRINRFRSTLIQIWKNYVLCENVSASSCNVILENAAEKKINQKP